MTQAIEQLIKLHDAQAVSIESFGGGRGRGVLTKEQQIAAFAVAQRRCPTGFDILLVKYKQDRSAEFRIHQQIAAWALRHGQQHAHYACILALSASIGRIVPSQKNHVAALLRRHSRRGMQARRLIDACNDTLREMIRRGGDPDYIEMQRKRANEIRDALRAWSEKEAMTTQACPRCSGTGRVKGEEACPECSGSGKVCVSNDDIYRSMKELGVTRDVFSQQYAPLVSQCVNWLSCMESEASDIISRRIRAELQGAA